MRRRSEAAGGEMDKPMKMKFNIGKILKVAGAAAGGALLVDPSVQTMVQGLVPQPWGHLVGAGFAIAALMVKSPREGVAPPPAAPRERSVGPRELCLEGDTWRHLCGRMR